MSKLMIISIWMGLFCSLLSCGDMDLKRESGFIEEEESTRLISIDSLTIDPAVEGCYGYIIDFFESNEGLNVKINFVDYLIGEKALEAEWQEEAYFVEGLDTISNITDGYYISNINSLVRTLNISEKASIQYVLDDNGFQKMQDPKIIDLELLKEYKEMNSLLFFQIKNETVLRIVERFLP